MLFKVDAAQLEWRTAIELSRDPIGMKEILEKLDAHENNRQAFVLPSRLIAKKYLFRTIFRGSGYAFANDPEFMHVSTSPKFWDNVNELFYTKYKRLDAWHKELADDVVNGRSINTPFGREFNIPMGRNYKGEIKIPWTVLSNYPVQATGADVMMIARLSLSRRIKQRALSAKLISTVHDDIKIDTIQSNIQELTDLCHQVFSDLPTNILKIFGYKWTVPLACECFQGMNMGEMTEVKPST